MFKLTNPFHPIGIPKTATYTLVRPTLAALRVTMLVSKCSIGKTVPHQVKGCCCLGSVLAADTTSYFAEIASNASTVV